MRRLKISLVALASLAITLSGQGFAAPGSLEPIYGNYKVVECKAIRRSGSHSGFVADFCQSETVFVGVVGQGPLSIHFQMRDGASKEVPCKNVVGSSSCQKIAAKALLLESQGNLPGQYFADRIEREVQTKVTVKVRTGEHNGYLTLFITQNAFPEITDKNERIVDNSFMLHIYRIPNKP
ncbi:MAG: hypothetical protein AB7F86_09420 [Bdellovibrionales bacterium]